MLPVRLSVKLTLWEKPGDSSVPRLSGAHFCLLQNNCCRSSGPIAK